ncbi:MAG: thioredoxin-disulfide reductase [Armatimonadetes bacterium]|nr:thioredoxin-disulfide reductase [Armatimonadota bacterium]
MPLPDCELTVVGAGVAGCTAAMYGRRYGLSVVVLERAIPGGQAALSPLIENYPGFPGGISGLELTQRIHQQAQDFGAQFITAEAMGISRAANGRWMLHTDHGDMCGIAIIVATGAAPRKLRVPGEEELIGRGVSYCATCDGFFFRGRAVAVIGGGNTAIEDAIYLADICEKVYVVHRRDELRAEKYLQRRLFEKQNVEIVWDSVVVEIVGREQVEQILVRNVKTNDHREIRVAGVFVAIGYEAKTDWLGEYVDRQDGFIVTNERMETRSPGIFAAGDVRVTPIRQITTAVGDATIAAYYAYHYVDAFKSGGAS